MSGLRTGRNRSYRKYRRLNAGELFSWTCMKTGKSCSIDKRPTYHPVVIAACLTTCRRPFRDIDSALPHTWNPVEMADEYDVSFEPLLRKVSGLLSLQGLCSGNVTYTRAAWSCSTRLNSAASGFQNCKHCAASKLQAFCGVDSQHTFKVFLVNWSAGQEQELPADKCSPR
jgi:hypothetical protein